jgi:putative SOS response-associated peptidase YedK
VVDSRYTVILLPWPSVSRPKRRQRLHPRYNVAPTQNIPIVRKEGEKKRFAIARWGLIPHWAKDIKIG